MPINKNAYIRYRTLDQCFRNRQKNYFIDDLRDACEEALVSSNFVGGVSRRQIYDDIRFMESDDGFSIELDRKHDGKKVYYRYTDTSFSINQQPLSRDEAQQLQKAIVTLTRFRGLPQYDWIEDVIANLEHRFNADGDSDGLVCFEQNQQLKGLEHLSTFIDAATEHRVLKVQYRSYKDGSKEVTRIVHPYYLKQYNNRWFAFCYDDATHYINNLALDRCLSIDPMPEMTFKVNEDIDFDHYFDDVVGVTLPNKGVKQKIILRTNERRYPYLSSKPIHPSQRIEDRKKCIISIEVMPNKELEQQILSFGPDLEVLEPAEFRNQIREKVALTLQQYNAG
jgi:predicted DNA-binding transcriptional regulator YafY